MSKERFLRNYQFVQKEALKKFQEYINKDATVETMFSYIFDVLDGKTPIQDGHKEWIESGECRRLSMSSFNADYWDVESTRTVVWSKIKDNIEINKRLLYLMPNKVKVYIDCECISEEWLKKHSFFSHMPVDVYDGLVPKELDFYALAHKYPYLLTWRSQLMNVSDPIIERDAVLLWPDDGFTFSTSELKESVFKILLAANKSEQLYAFIDRHVSDEERQDWFNRYIVTWLSKSIHNNFPSRYLSFMNPKSCVLIWAHTNAQERHDGGMDVLDFPADVRPIIEQYKNYKDLGFFDEFINDSDYFKGFYAGGSQLLDKMSHFYEQQNANMEMHNEVPLW